MDFDSKDMDRRSSPGRAFIWFYLPYCLEKLKDGSYLPLNRAYKPVGTTSGDWVDYEAQPAAARLRLSLDECVAIDHANSPMGDGTVFLYDDETAPWQSEDLWQSYLERLSLLAGFDFR